MIPEGWQEIKLQEFGRCYNGVTYSPEDVVASDGLLILRSSNIQGGRLAFDDNIFVRPDIKISCLTQEGDILICVRNGSRNLIGKTARITSDAVGHAHGAFMSLFRPTEPDFVYQLFNSSTYDKQVKQNLGATINSINTSNLYDFRFIVPPKDERVQIAEILSAWDEAIAVQERLVDNARMQKQALMQRLLGGKHRLPRFSKPWKWVAFADVFGRVKTKNDEGNTNVLTISAQHGLISQVEYFNKSVASDDVRGYTLLQRGDFAYNKSYSDGYPMGAIKPLDRYDSGIVSSLYICFRLTKRGFDHGFFRHYFEAGLFNREISAIAQEGARNHGLLNVSVVEFFETSLHIPQPDEQAAIAKVINAAEDEEQAYQAQLAAFRQEKAALMQQLLTGKRRVKLDRKEAA